MQKISLRTFKYFSQILANVSGYLYNITMNIKTLDIKKAGEILNLPEGHIVYPHAVVNTPKGLATVCFEGVGWFMDEGLYKVMCGGEWNTYFKTLTRSELLGLIIEEPEMTLHKLIDPHNDRTRSNLWAWENQIKNSNQNVVGSSYNEVEREETNA
jgi:hypothetical protein